MDRREVQTSCLSNEEKEEFNLERAMKLMK